MPAEEKNVSFSLKQKEMVDLKEIGLTAEELKAFEEVVRFKPVKFDIQVIGPAGIDAGDAEQAGWTVVDRYIGTLKKQALICFQAVAKAVAEDRSGSKDAYSTADNALGKFNKFAKDVLDHIRVDIREAVAKKTGKKAKEFMTVGRVAFKEYELIPGTFEGESALDKKSEKDDDLAAAFKFKKWQYVALGASTDKAKVLVNRKKEFTRDKMKVALKELFPKDDHAKLVFARGLVLAESETKVIFQFLEKSKVGKNPKTYRRWLKDGLADQLKKTIAVKVFPVKELSKDGLPESGTKGGSTQSRSGPTGAGSNKK